MNPDAIAHIMDVLNALAEWGLSDLGRNRERRPLIPEHAAVLDGLPGGRIERRLDARGHREISILAAAWMLPIGNQRYAVICRANAVNAFAISTPPMR